MPVYLVHGFRWPREGFTGIRVHTIVHNLENCSAEYIQNANSREDLLESFRKSYPELMKELDVSGRHLEFIEQYDPEDTQSLDVVSQPYAYVVDKVVEVAGNSMTQPVSSPKDKPVTSRPVLSINVEDVITNGPGLTPKAWEAMADLRDKIASGEKIGWWIVYNGDPVRAYETDEDEDDEGGGNEENEATTPTAESAPSATPLSSEKAETMQQVGPPVPPKSSLPKASSIGSKLLPTRSKPDIVKPEAVLPSPKDEKIPEPPKLKEVAKKSGFRNKFFGKKI